jgi:epoxyqueuosine reductase
MTTENKLQTEGDFNAAPLVDAGINLSAVFNLSELPPTLYSQIEAVANNSFKPRQLLLLAHAGNRFWRKLALSEFSLSAGSSSDPVKTNQSKQNINTISEVDHPIDEYSIQQVSQHLQRSYPSLNFQILYPSSSDFAKPIGLQQFGKLAGWHYDSPLKIGINQIWGTWFAYRVLLLCDGQFTPTEKLQSKPPCTSCSDKPCISECPANAVTQTDFDLNCCSQYRASEQSRCSDRCVARLACPVATEHRYPIDQIQYHYGRSMQIIRQMFQAKG